jgi:hypothetical protein
VDWYVSNAETIFRVRAQTVAEAEGFPPSRGQQRLIVEEVLKGVDTAQFLSQPGGTLKPGQAAIALIQYEHPTTWEPAIQLKLRRPAKTVIWPIDGARVLTGTVPAATQWGGGPGPNVPFVSVAALIKSSSPEEVGLYRQVVDACLFPAKLLALAHVDSQRAIYVRFAAAIRDLARDVKGIAALLESSDSAVRHAAANTLERLTRAGIDGPKQDTPALLEKWSRAWEAWWDENESSRTWYETSGAWVVRSRYQPWPRQWPPVPWDLPTDRMPAELLRAVQNKDAATFAPAFRRWLDSGVLRDRQIRAAATRNSLVDSSHLGGAIGQYGEFLPAAPRLRPDVILDGNLSPTDRLAVIALVSALWHYDRFVRERQQALEYLRAQPSNSDDLRRAAFWELRDTNIVTPGSLAKERLATKK